MDRLSPFDLMFLRLESADWPCHFAGLAVLEGGPLLDAAGKLRRKEVVDRLERRLALVPQLRRRLYVPRPFGGRPLWVDDDRFAIERHVHETTVVAPGDERELLEAAARVYARPLSRRRPLWELWFLTGLSDGRLGVMLKLHHAVADGMATVGLMGALFDLDRDAADPAPERWEAEPIPTEWSLLVDNISNKASALRRAAVTTARPVQLFRRARGSVRRTRRIALSYAGANEELQAPRTSLNQRVRAGRRIRFLRMNLATMKEAAHAHDGKVNDVVLDLWSGGLRALLVSRGESVEGIELVTGMAVSLRPATEAGTVDNQTGWTALRLPVREVDPRRRLESIASRTRKVKAEQQPGPIAGFLAALAATPVGRSYTAHQRTSNVIVTNVPGPPVPVFMFGARVHELLPVIELVGNIGLTLCAFSYAGEIFMVVTADAQAFPDLDVLMAGMDREWQALVEGAITEAARA